MLATPILHMFVNLSKRQAIYEGRSTTRVEQRVLGGGSHNLHFSHHKHHDAELVWMVGDGRTRHARLLRDRQIGDVGRHGGWYYVGIVCVHQSWAEYLEQFKVWWHL